MRKLLFENASVESFAAFITPLWLRDDIKSYLFGEDILANEILALALHEGIVLSDANFVGAEQGNKLIIITEQDGSRLQKLLLSFLKLENIYVIAPITDWHFSKKPLFLISIPKAGTHLLYQLAGALGYQPGVEAPEYHLGQNWYCVEYENSHTAASDFFVDTVRRSPFGNRHHSFMKSPALFIYRHPLDTLISEAHYYHIDGNTAFSSWFESLNFLDRIKILLSENQLIGSFSNRISRFLPWLKFQNVIKISFEELVGASGGGSESEQAELIWSIMLKLQVPGNPDEIGSSLFNKKAATFREGQIGSYKRELPMSLVQDFSIQNKNLLSEFGYLINEMENLPSHRFDFREQNLSYSKVDFDNKPLNLESMYLGCNLVRYNGLIYAIPLSAGEVHLEALAPETLLALPSAPTLRGLKDLLVLGLDGRNLRLEALGKLGAVLRGDGLCGSYYSFWRDVESPCLVEEYGSFNIIIFKKRFYGIRQSLGQVDLTQDLLVVLQSYSVDDLVVGSSLPQVRDEIDQVSAAYRVRSDVTKDISRQLEARQRSDRDLRKAVSSVSSKYGEIFARLSDISNLIDETHVQLKTQECDMLEYIRSECNKIKKMLSENEQKHVADKHEMQKVFLEHEKKIEKSSENICDKFDAQLKNYDKKFLDITKKLEYFNHQSEQIFAEWKSLFNDQVAKIDDLINAKLAERDAILDVHGKILTALSHVWPIRFFKSVKYAAERKK